MEDGQAERKRSWEKDQGGGVRYKKRARFEKKRVESRGRFLEDTLVSARLEQQWDEIMRGGCNRSTITTSFLCVFTHYVLAVLFRPIPK